jgi:radical SAM protein with 4Fe4S-binding SPASM domain
MDLPAIYQIETVSACDLACPMCLRTEHMGRKPSLVQPQLFLQMHARGEFANTTYIELQMAGEPTIHPWLHQIIDHLQNDVGLAVGLSTHGLNMRKPGVVDALMALEALTISVDSVDPEIYARMRVPATLDKLVENLGYFFRQRWLIYEEGGGYRPRVIDLQVIDMVGGQAKQAGALAAFAMAKGWLQQPGVRVVNVEDSFAEMDGRAIVGSQRRPNKGQICWNPFGSVSITATGDVVSCCYIFDPKRNSPNWYGNIYENTLAEIWAGPRVQEMRNAHRRGHPLPGQCSACYDWGSLGIHSRIVKEILQAR